MNHQNTQNETRSVLDADWREAPREDYTVRVFHGTTHAFEFFDCARKGNREGAFGLMSYFTSSFDNAERHYVAAVEMDVRVAHAAAQLSGEDPDRVADMSARMRAELVGDSPRVVEANVQIGRAFHLDGNSPLFDGGVHTLADGRREDKQGRLVEDEPLVFPALGGQIARARDGVAQEYGHDDEESFQDSGDWEYDDALAEMDEGEDRVVGKARSRLSRAVSRAMESGGFGQTPTVEAFTQALDRKIPALERLGHTQLFHALQDTSGQLGADIETGALAGFASQVVRNLGFDAIVLHDADKRWPGFGMEPGTKHVHVFADGEAERIAIVASHPVGERPAQDEKPHGRLPDRAAHIQARAQEMEHEARAAAPLPPKKATRAPTVPSL